MTEKSSHLELRKYRHKTDFLYKYKSGYRNNFSDFQKMRRYYRELTNEILLSEKQYRNAFGAKEIFRMFPCFCIKVKHFQRQFLVIK